MRTLVVTLAAFVPLSIWADSVVLKDGKIYEGRFTGFSGNQVTLELERHARRTFSVAEIESIRFEKAAATGDRARSAVATPIDQRYTSGAQNALGEPAGEEQTAPDGRRIMYFEHGAIIWNHEDGAVVEVNAH